jgi:hypothetical protein
MTRTVHILIGVSFLVGVLAMAGCPYQRTYNAETFAPRFIEQPRLERETVYLTVFPTQLDELPKKGDTKEKFKPKIEKVVITADGEDVYWPVEITTQFNDQYGWTQTAIFTTQGQPRTMHVMMMVQHIGARFRLEADMVHEDGEWIATFQDAVRTL